MRATSKPPEKATYVAPQPDKDWLLNVQRTLYTQSRSNSAYVFRKLWGFVTDPRNLRTAVARVARNRGRRTAGIDGVTVGRVIANGVDAFVAGLRQELRAAYRPVPVRRVLIPKAGQPGKYRPLGIPTVTDRVVQAALKNILEPIFEADFFPVSHGFRPGHSVHSALCHLRMALLPRVAGLEGEVRLPYQWAVEGDIKACFDSIDHHALMVRVRQRVQDAKVNRLLVAFLKAGVMSDGEYQRTEIGTPQGGILSPLLANIALSAIEERYERYVWPRPPAPVATEALDLVVQERARRFRVYDRRHGKPVCFPIRYADDFIVLVQAGVGASDSFEQAAATARDEKAALATLLRDRLHLQLSESKTLVTPVTSALKFLGHLVRVRAHPGHGRMVSTIVIPRDRSQLFRERIKALFRRSTTSSTLAERLRVLNPLLRGWGNFYKHAWGASRVFRKLDHYVWWTIFRWLKKRHANSNMKAVVARYAWRKPGGRAARWHEGEERVFELATISVSCFRMGTHPKPLFARPSAESPVQTERCTPGSEGGARKPAGESR
jgi:RNA-directed DNA polymerase